jgi:hypothetical protein
MPGFRLEAIVCARIGQLLQLCGEEPSSAFAARTRALPLFRDPSGCCVAIRPDGTIAFFDDATGRVLTDLPEEWRRRAVEELERRYPEIAAEMG